MLEERKRELREIIKTTETKGWKFLEKWLHQQMKGSDKIVHDITQDFTKREFENGKYMAYKSIFLKIDSCKKELEKE